MKITQDGSLSPAGAVALRVTRDLGDLRARRPVGWGWRLRNWLAGAWRGDLQVAAFRFVGQLCGGVWIESSLAIVVRHADGTITDYGIVSRRVVTDTGVGYIVDAFQNLVELENMKYHGFGTGTGAEGAGDTALGTEFTTEYAVNSTRPTGTQTETSANIYQTVGTFAPDSGGTLAVTEHGIFSASSAGVLLDRSKFTAVNVAASADSIVATYSLTLTSGS